VNRNAIVERDGHAVVFVVRDGRAVMVPVTVGAKIGDTIAIDAEVKTGDKAIEKPAPSLGNSVLVKMATEK
jgi:HlyD family secretion protein